MLKRLIFILIIGGTCAFLYSQEVKVQDVSGQVQVQRKGSGWETLNKGDVIPLSATVSTGFMSRAVLLFPRATVVVQPLTRMTVDQLEDSGSGNSTNLSLRTGRITAVVKKSDSNPTRFQVKSPVATAAVRGTQFTFNGFQLQVQEGVVAFGSEGGRVVTVPLGASSEMLAGGVPQEVVDAVVQAVSVDPSTATDEIVSLLNSLGIIDLSNDLIVTVQ